MQYSLPLESENRLARVHERLLTVAGGLAPAGRRFDPVSQMILAMLSGRTRDEIAMPVFHRLGMRLEQRWEALAGMHPNALVQLIDGTTFADRKAEFMPAAMQAILNRRGNVDLGFLAERPVVDARSWLEGLPGIGPKTSTAVLNSSTLHQRILIVDTPHLRVARRLGLVPEKAGLERATRLLNRQLPDDWSADDTEAHHFLMRDLGKRTCTHARPNCPVCVLHVLCPSATGCASAPSAGGTA